MRAELKELKVGQVWTLSDGNYEWEILGIDGNIVWMKDGCGSYETRAYSYLTTMITDEHGNKPTEDNDDVVFREVTKQCGGGYGVKDKPRDSWSHPLMESLGVIDEDGRTCVGFLYEHQRGYYFSTEPISTASVKIPPSISQETMGDNLSNIDFRIPVKAVFKRLGAR